MKIPIKPRPSPARPGDGLSFSKTLPFYNDDVVSKVGIDASDLEKGINVAIRAFNKYNRELKKNLGDTTVIQDANKKVSDLVQTIETIKDGKLFQQTFKFHVDKEGEVGLVNIITKTKELKNSIESLTQDTKDFAGQLARLGSGTSGGKLENIVTKLAKPSARAVGTPKELEKAYKAKVDFQLNVNDVLKQGQITRDRLERIFLDLHLGIPVKEADLALVGKLTASFQRMKEAIANIGAEARKSGADLQRIKLDEQAGGRANDVKRLLESRLGTPFLHPQVDPGQGRKLVDQYLAKIQQITKATEGISNTDFKKIINAAREGGEAYEKLSLSQKDVAIRISELISITDKFGRENERVVSNAIRNNKALAAVNQSAVASPARVVATHDLLTKGKRSLVEQLKPNYANISSYETRGQTTSIQKNIEKLNELISSGRVSLQEYDKAIDSINNKTFLPPGATADLVKARDLISNIANVIDTVENRATRLRKAADVAQAKKDFNADLGRREKAVVSVTQQRLGPLYIAPEVDEGKARGLIDTWKGIYRQLAQTSKDFSKEQINDLLTAAENAVKTHGQSLIDVDQFDDQGFAKALNKLIQFHRKVETENNDAIQRINKKNADYAKTAQSALVGSRPEERGRITRTHDLLTQGGGGRTPLLSQLRPGSFGELPSGITRGETNRIQNYLNTINQLLASGKQSWDDYDQAVSNVINKKLVPPNASADFRTLQNSIAGTGNVLDTVRNRMSRMNEALVSFKNVLRLGIVSEIYNIYSQLRALADQSVTTFNKLTIQISQIQAITQDAIAPTSQWAQALREVSDATGKDLTEISVAAYDALSNQITRSKDDTVAFLNTATEFGKTVGATPVEAVNLLSSSINAYGKSVNDAEQLSAEFFAVVDIGKVKVADLQNILGRVGITAATLGVKTHELGAALAVLTQNGLTTEDAITRLNNLLVKLFNPTKEMEKLFLRFGVTSAQQFIAINDGLGGTVRAIEEAVKRGDAATAELFPEIRTLAGYFGLSGQNAAKFADTIDQVLNSLGKFKGAKALTGQLSIGQRFETEIQRIKNVFSVDFAQGFNEAIVNLSDVVGGLSNRIKNLLDIGLSFIKIVGPVLAVSLAIQGLSGKIQFLAKAWALLTVAFTKNPIIAAVTAMAAAYQLLGEVLKRADDSAKQFVETLGKTKQTEFSNTRYNKQLEVSDRLAIKHSETIKEQITKAWSIASANMQKVYNKAIEQSGKKLDALTERTKSAFSDVSNLISKTISGLENYGPEAGKIQRKLPLEQAERDRDAQVSYLQELLSAQKGFESHAGFQGVSNAQVQIYDQIVAQINQGTEQLRQQANRIFTETLDPSEQKAAVDEYIASIDKAIAEYKKLESEIISSGVAAGRSWAQIQAQLDAIVAPRLEPLFQARASAPKTLSAALENAKKAAKDALPAFYDLQGEMKAVEKEFLDIDLEKSVSQIGPIYEGKKLVKSRKQNVQEQVFKPFEEKLKSLQDRFETARPELEQRGLAGPLESALSNLQERIDARRKQLDIHLTDLVNKADIDSNTQLINSFSNSFVAAMNASTASSKKLRDSIQQIYGELGKLAGSIDIVKLPRDIFGREEGSIKNLKTSNDQLQAFIRDIENLQSQAQKPLIRPEEYIPNVDAALKAAQQSLQPLKQELKNLTPDQYNKTFVGQQEKRLNTVEEFITRLKLQSVTEETNQQKTKELEVEYSKLQSRINQVGENFKKSGVDFDKFVRDNKESIPQLLSDIQRFNTDLRGHFANITPPNTLKQEYPLITGPTRSQQIATGGNIEIQLLEEAKKSNSLNEQQVQLLQGLLNKQPGTNIPTVPTPGSDTTGRAIPTTPAQSNVTPEQIDRLIRTVEASKTVPEAPQTPQTESMGGEISYYAKGGWAWMQPRGTDTVPAMLTPGEYVMPRKMTERYRHILEAMRTGTYKEDGGEIILAGKGDLGNRDKDIVTFMSAGGLLLEKGTYEEKHHKKMMFMASGGEVEKAIVDLTKFWNSQPGSDIGSAKKHFESLHKFASIHPNQILQLADYLHVQNVPRQQIIDSLKGLDVTKSSASLLSKMYKGRAPSIQVTNETDRSLYDSLNGRILLSKNTPKTINPLLALGHELEHSKQQPGEPGDVGHATAEIVAVLGDIALSAKSYEQTTGRKLDKLVNLSPTFKMSASQLADSFEKQGYFKGKSATEILASPLGKQLLNRLISKPTLPNRINNYPNQSVSVGSGSRSESFGLPNINLIGGPDSDVVRSILSRVPFGYNSAPPLMMGGNASYQRGGVIYADSGGFLNPFTSFLPPIAQLALAGAEAYSRASQSGSTLRNLDPKTLASLRTPSLAPSTPQMSIQNSPIGVGGSGNFSSVLPDINTIGGIDSNIMRSILGRIPYGWNFMPPLTMGSQGGLIGYYAKGGLMKPKGEDVIPAMLSQGEYVMPKGMTEKYLPTLERMRGGVFKDKEVANTTSIFNRNKHEVKDYSKIINDHGITYHVASGGSLESHKSVTSYYIKGGLIQVESRNDSPRHLATNNIKQYLPDIGQMVQNSFSMKSRGSDTIPAMLSRGEYIMPKDKTERYLPVLEGMRKGIYMANGGMVGLIEELGSKNYNRSNPTQLIDLPNRVVPSFRAPINKISTSIDNSRNSHVNIHVNMNNSPMENGVGRKIGKEIQREIRRGNLKLS